LWRVIQFESQFESANLTSLFVLSLFSLSPSSLHDDLSREVPTSSLGSELLTAMCHFHLFCKKPVGTPNMLTEHYPDFPQSFHANTGIIP
jgi:hypothetical protein